MSDSVPVVKCCVDNCPVSSRNTKGKFFEFPSGRYRSFQRNKWIDAIRKHNGPSWRPTDSSAICGAHFTAGEPSYFPKCRDYTPSLFPAPQRPIIGTHELRCTTVSVKQFALEYIKHDALMEEPTPANINNAQRRAAYRRLARALRVAEPLARAWERRFRSYFEDKMFTLASSGKVKLAHRLRGSHWVDSVERKLHTLEKIHKRLQRCVPREGRAASPGGVVAALCDAAAARGALCSTPLYSDVRRALRLAAANTALHAVWVTAQRLSLEQVRCAGRAGDAPPRAAPRAARAVADLVLLHTDVDTHRLITDESVSLYEETAALHHLWQLIQRHRIEEPAPRRSRVRAQRWTRLHKDYTDSGRIASIIVLQRRWHELKLQARDRLAAYWKQVNAKTTSAATTTTPTATYSVPSVIRLKPVATDPTVPARIITASATYATPTTGDDTVIVINPRPIGTSATEAPPPAASEPPLPRPAPLHLSILKRYPHVARAGPSWRSQVAEGLVVTRPLEEPAESPSDSVATGDGVAGSASVAGSDTGGECSAAAALDDITHMYQYYRSADDTESLNESSAAVGPYTNKPTALVSSSEDTDTDTEALLVIDESITSTQGVIKEEKIDISELNTAETEFKTTEDVNTKTTIDVLHAIDPTNIKTEIVFESDSEAEDLNIPFAKDIKDEILLDVKKEDSVCVSSRIVFDDEMPAVVVKKEIGKEKDDVIDKTESTANSEVTVKKEDNCQLSGVDGESQVIANNNFDDKNILRDKDTVNESDDMRGDDVMDGLEWNSDQEMDQLDDRPPSITASIDSKLIMQSTVNLIKVDETPAWRKYASRNKSINVSRINTQQLTPKTSDKYYYVTNRHQDDTTNTDGSREASQTIKREFIDDEPLSKDVVTPCKKLRVSSSESDDNKPLLFLKNKNDTNSLLETTKIEIDSEIEDKVKHEQTPSSEVREPDSGSTSNSGTVVMINDKFTVKRSVVLFKSVGNKKLNDSGEDYVINKGREDRKGKNSCHSAASTLEWSERFDTVFGDTARVAKRVELPSLEEVRRINSNILTAQVAPITAKAESIAPLELQAPADQRLELVQEGGGEQDDVVPSGEQLEAVLYELSTMSKAQQVLEPAYCCAARRHREVNDARRRIGLDEIQLHNHGGAACACCCARLCDAGVRRRLALQLEALHDDITKMLKGISSTPAASDKKTIKRDKKRKKVFSGKSNATSTPATSTPATSTPATSTPATSTPSTSVVGNNLTSSTASTKPAPKKSVAAATHASAKSVMLTKPLKATKSTKDKPLASLAKGPSLNKRRSRKPRGTDTASTTEQPSPAAATAGDGSVGTTAASVAPDNGYNEWLRQKSLNAQYFFIQGTGKAHSKKDKTSTASKVIPATSSQPAALMATSPAAASAGSVPVVAPTPAAAQATPSYVKIAPKGSEPATSGPTLPQVAAPEPQPTNVLTDSTPTTSIEAKKYPKISVVPFENLAKPKTDNNPSSLVPPSAVMPTQAPSDSSLSILEQYARTLTQESSLPGAPSNTSVNALSLQLPGPQGPQTTIIMAVTLPPEQAPQRPVTHRTSMTTVDLTSDPESFDGQNDRDKKQSLAIPIHKVTSGPPRKRSPVERRRLIKMSCLGVASLPRSPDENFLSGAQFEQSLADAARLEQGVTFTFKADALRLKPSLLPCGTMLLCIDGARTPLLPSYDPVWCGYLLLTDKRLPCSIPTYWTVNTYSATARVVPSHSDAATHSGSQLRNTGVALEKVDASNTWRIISNGEPVSWRAWSDRGAAAGPPSVKCRSAKHYYSILTAVTSVEQFRALVASGSALQLLWVPRGRWWPLHVRQEGSHRVVHCDLPTTTVLKNLTRMLNVRTPDVAGAARPSADCPSRPSKNAPPPAQIEE